MSDETALAAKAPSTIAGNGRGLELRGLEEMWRFANYVAKSGLAPKGIQTPEAIMIALQMGMELGLTPMASLQNIAVINGRPAVFGDGMLAVCQGSGQFDHSAFSEVVEGQGDNRTATVTVKRKGGISMVSTFSVADAKRAKLWGKPGPWTEHPDRMLKMRARSFGLRDVFADVLRGFDCKEEMEGIPMTVERVDAPQADRTASLLAKLKKVEAEPQAAVFEPAEGELFPEEVSHGEL